MALPISSVCFLLLQLLLTCVFSEKLLAQGTIGNGQVVSGSATDNQFSVWNFTGAEPGRYVCASVTASAPNTRFTPVVGFGTIGIFVDGAIGTHYGGRYCAPAKTSSGQIYIENVYRPSKSPASYSYTLQLTMPGTPYAGGGGMATNQVIYSGTIKDYNIDIWTFYANIGDIVTISVKAPCTVSFCAEFALLYPDGPSFGVFGPSSGGEVAMFQAERAGMFSVFVFGQQNYTGPVGLNSYSFSISGSTATAGVIKILDDVLDTTSLTDIVVAPTVGSLTAGSSFRPHHQTKALYIGCFTVDSSKPIPNCHLSISLKDVPQSGGHAHEAIGGDNTRPLGELALPADEDKLSKDGSSLSHKQLSVTTDASGEPVGVLYLPSLLGGDVVAKVNEVGGLSIPESDLQVHVRAPNADCKDPATANIFALCDLAAVEGPNYYVLTGTTTAHPSNHFGQKNFINNVLPGIASDWVTNPYVGEPVPSLAINDMSLIDGGVFDYRDQNWMPPHKAHRWGDEADIGSGNGKSITYWIPPDQRVRLLKILKDHGYKTITEVPCHPTVSEANCSHFHIRPIEP